MAKTNNKQKPPNTLLSSQTTRPARNPRAGQPYQHTSHRDREQLSGCLPLRVRRDQCLESLVYAINLSAQTLKDLDEQRVAAVDVKHVVDLGLPVGDKAGQHQSGAGPDV